LSHGENDCEDGDDDFNVGGFEYVTHVSPSLSPPQDNNGGDDCLESDVGDSRRIEDDIIPSSLFGEQKTTEDEDDSSLHLANSPLANVGCACTSRSLR
jgi:hypothetical protein